MAFSAVLDAIVPMGALRGLAFWTQETIVGGGRLGVRWSCERGACENTGEDGRHEFYGTLWHLPLR